MLRRLNGLRLLDLDVGKIWPLLILSDWLMISLIGAAEIVFITLHILWLVFLRAVALGERESVWLQKMGVARRIEVDVCGLGLADRLTVRAITPIALN